jgi:small-conductance mechanosensitive channel
MDTSGIDVTVFLAGSLVAGLVLAFALQDTLSNYFSGLHLMLDQPFKVGDTILVGDDYCEVISVGFRSTRLYNIFNHDVQILPNNQLANQTVINKTEPDSSLRINVIVGVAYGSPVDKVKEIILDAVRSQDDVIVDAPERKPSVQLIDFAESSLTFRTRFFIEDLHDQWSVRTAVREHINQRFADEGISIPFPQRTLSFLEEKDEKSFKDSVPSPRPDDGRPAPSA